jgi:hypothetical protein
VKYGLLSLVRTTNKRQQGDGCASEETTCSDNFEVSGQEVD